MVGCNINFNVDVNKCLSGLQATLRLGRPKSGIKKLEKKMARLRRKRDDIKSQIDQAEHGGRIPTKEVSQWLLEVETLEGKVATIKQDFQNIGCFSCYYCCSINRRVAEKLGEINELMSQAGAPDLIATDLPKSSIKELEKEMTRLRCKRDDMKNQLDHAEREGKIPTNEVNQWLLAVETLEGQVANIEQDFRKAAEKLGESKELMNRADALNPIATFGPPEHTATLPISHQPSVGIESYVENIVGYIESGEAKIIGIYGMGGVGKTTILNHIQRHYLNHRKFDRVIWVMASKDCQLKRLQMDIAKSLDLETLQKSDNEKTCGNNLFNYLKNKNCLLLLDDIWKDVDLRLLGMAIEEGQQQQPLKVVVLTTRSETVCGLMKAEKKIKVKCLNPNEAWQLFEQKCEAGVLSSDAGIQFVAGELVKECAGLPLALATVARAMTGKKSWEAWKVALHQIRDKHVWTTIGPGLSEDSLVMYQVFKLSYDNLENDSIRECLLCCALWRENYEIDIFEELIPCWIGCGIIREFNVINEAFEKGYSYLDALMAASLLEHSSTQEYHYREKFVKMHDVIRDMVLFMVSGLKGNGRKWIVKAEVGLRHLPRQTEWQEAERASFMENQITIFSEFGISIFHPNELALRLAQQQSCTIKQGSISEDCKFFQGAYFPTTLTLGWGQSTPRDLSPSAQGTLIFSKLSMLILRGNKTLKTIPPSLLANMPHLTYLDIARCGITDFPMQICSLTELQYLDLSANNITSLPAEFGRLVKLEYLILRWHNSLTVSDGIISNLSMLRWLDIRGNPLKKGDWWLNELKDFKGHKLSVGIYIEATTRNIERLNELPNELPNVSIWDLTIVGDTSEPLNLNLGTPQWSYNISDKLEYLSFNDARVHKLMLSAGVGHESSFRSLKKLSFYSLQLLEEISLKGGFYNLREIIFMECPVLKDVSCVLQLPCLSLLQINDCPRMEELISDTGNSNSISSIKILTLRNLPELTCIANQSLHFPYLEYIHVEDCSKLNKLSFGAEIRESKLKEIRGDETWWHNLKWDDESHKNFLTPRFIATRKLDDCLSTISKTKKLSLSARLEFKRKHQPFRH